MAGSRTVGIFDVSAHKHILAYLCKMAVTDRNEVIVFTTESIYEAIEPDVAAIADEIEWVLKPEGQSLGRYLLRVETIATDRLDALMVSAVFGSLRQLYHYSRFTPDCRNIVWVFNANRWLKADLSLRRGIRGNLHLLIRRRILGNYDAINVEYPPMREFVRESTGFDREVYTLMPTLFEGRWADPPDDRFVCSVPGNIHPMRRNYELAMDVFEDLFDRHGDDFEVRLLGRPHGTYGERIVDRCRSLRKEGHSIEHPDEWIPMDDYHTAIQESHVLFCPIYELANDAFADEVYGATKGSGNVFDGLRNATPLLLPQHFRLDDSIRDSTVTYRDPSDLKGVFESLIANPDAVDRLRRNALEGAERFSLENQQRSFGEVIDDVLR